MTHYIQRLLPRLFLTLLLTSFANVYAEATHENIVLSSGEKISAEVFRDAQDPAALRVLWIAPDFGIESRTRQMAEALAQRGMEVWQVDAAEALFLPRSATTMREIPGAFVADLITALTDHRQRQVLVISGDYGAVPALRGIHAWQARNPSRPSLLGAVLFSPALFSQVPQLGAAPEFVAEVRATSAPLYIFQAAKSGNRWHLPALLAPLQQHASVYVEILAGVTSLFYDEDTAPETLAMLHVMPEKIEAAVRQLRRHPIPLTALPIPKTAETKGSGLDTQLKPYRGSVVPQPFALMDAGGETFRVEDFKDRVTLINFWASWCGPCVEEIPSLNRLKEAMQGKPFQLISINYAETPQRIHEFMKRVAVDFPVLMDSDGQVTAQWKVVAYPSTFVIGPGGTIQYGVNAAIPWDTEEVMQQLNQLLPAMEQTQ
jgi:thiol-disulfide isomerase/thioredoxin